MFIGEYNHTLDDKGRLSVPKKFLKDLSKGAVVTRGFDGCLFLYTKNEWQRFVDKQLSTLSFAQANARALSRLMLAGAMDVEVDKQGRIMIPEYLRQFAGLSKDAIVAGLYSRLEIWDAGKWSAYKQQTEAQSTEIAERMGELGV